MVGAALLTDLSRHYRVTVFDLPGAGYSGAATASFSLGWLADMTAGFALTQPGSLTRSCSVGDSAARSRSPSPSAIPAWLRRWFSSTPPQEVRRRPSPREALHASWPYPVRRRWRLARLLFPRTSAGLLERGLWVNSLLATPDWLTAGAITAEARLQAAFWKASPLTPELSRVTIPALVVSGSDDLVFPPGNAPLLEGDLRHARLANTREVGLWSDSAGRAGFRRGRREIHRLSSGPAVCPADGAGRPMLPAACLRHGPAGLCRKNCSTCL